jgi:hypothetical protein
MGRIELHGPREPRAIATREQRQKFFCPGAANLHLLVRMLDCYACLPATPGRSRLCVSRRLASTALLGRFGPGVDDQ